MSSNTDSSLIEDFSGFAKIFVTLSNYAYLFKAIDCLDQYDPNEKNQESIVSTIAILLISALLFLTILKIIVIYLSYYFIIIPKAIYNLIHTLIKTKGKIRIGLVLTKIGKAALSHVQTFYSYNFYSYIDPISGVLLMLIYLAFILSTIMMSILYFIDPISEQSSIPQNLLYIAGFLPQLFIQIYIPIFYLKRKIMKFKLFFSGSFTFWLFLTGMTAYIFNQDKYFDDINSLIFVSLVYSISLHVFIAIIQMLVFHKLFFYSLNKKSIRMVLAETERNSTEVFDLHNSNKGKIFSLAKRYRLNNFYYDSHSDHFFETNDRFHRRRFLMICFLLYLLDNLFLISLFVILIVSPPELKKDYDTLLQSGLLLETVLLNIIAWNTFMKIKISKVYLY